MIVRYQQLGISLNEMNRSMGLFDLAPEVIVPPVVEKLAFIHALVQQGRRRERCVATAARHADGACRVRKLPAHAVSRSLRCNGA